ncbi:hypothetical protein O5173_25935, partial [Escherichia coli]|nr:hypothetical protein [Escherichia coli]
IGILIACSIVSLLLIMFARDGFIVNDALADDLNPALNDIPALSGLIDTLIPLGFNYQRDAADQVDCQNHHPGDATPNRWYA